MEKMQLYLLDKKAIDFVIIFFNVRAERRGGSSMLMSKLFLNLEKRHASLFTSAQLTIRLLPQRFHL